jgi:hypothetical protein
VPFAVKKLKKILNNHLKFMKILFTALLFISNCIYAQVDTLDDQIEIVALFETVYEKVHPDTIKHRTFVINQIFKEPKFTFTIDAWGCFSGKYIDYMFILLFEMFCRASRTRNNVSRNFGIRTVFYAVAIFLPIAVNFLVLDYGTNIPYL